MTCSAFCNKGKPSAQEAYDMLSESQKALIDGMEGRTGSSSSGTKYSIIDIVGENGKNYGNGVRLDSELLTGLTDSERIQMVKEYVKELGGSTFTAYDQNGNEVTVSIAKASDKFKNKGGKRVPANKDLAGKNDKSYTKQEAIALIDELVTASRYDGKKKPNYPHGWLDNNGKNDWEYWKTYLQDKNNAVFEATLNIAATKDGEKILYDITPIKMVGRSVKSDALPTNSIVPQSDTAVNNYSMQNSAEDAGGSYSLMEDDQYKADISAAEEEIIASKMEAAIEEEQAAEAAEIANEISSFGESGKEYVAAVVKRESNAKTFGYEYALYNINKATGEKAARYVADGVTWEQYYDAYVATRDLDGGAEKKAAIDKAVSNANQKQKNLLYDAFNVAKKYR